jgi:glycosyltransferase involved in cell wall biosynthesis
MNHVALVLPVLQPAGAERIVAELARRLPQRGFATSVICLEDERAPIGDEISAAGIPVKGLRLSRRRTLACAKALSQSLPQTRPLIVHAHLFHANMAARAAIALMPRNLRDGVHVLNTVHIAERRFRPWQFMLDWATSKKARCEICVSRAVAEFQQQKTGLPREFFRVIENGVDLSLYSPVDATKNNLRVLSLGRLDLQKDYATLLRAWKLVEPVLPEATLTIAGEGPERAALMELIKSLGLATVQMPGFVQDVPELLNAASVYVQPSAWEGFGLAVAEAMACALPVIVSDADSLPEIVTHGKTGLVVKRGQPGLLANAIIKLLRERTQANALGAAARQEALSRFSIDRMVADYAVLYQEVLTG